MDIAPTLTMYRGTNQEFATKYMSWFFLIETSPLPEQMIGLDPEFYLQELFEGLYKAPGAIAPEEMNEYVRAFSNAGPDISGRRSLARWRWMRSNSLCDAPR
jgi:haloacetate dehalogenase